MSDHPQVLDPESVEFLLELLELREPLLSGAAAELRPEPAARLMTSGLLVPHDHEATAASQADHEDVPVSLMWSEQGSGLAYFSAAAGLVAVPRERLIRHRADMLAVLGSLVAGLDVPPGRPPTTLIDGLLWEIGGVRIGKRPARTPIWFSRRLADRGVQQQVADAARARPHNCQRVILTSSRLARIRDVSIPGAAVVALRDVLETVDRLAVSADILDARLRGMSVPAQGPLVLSPDGTRLTILGGDPIPFKTPDQMDAIRQLVEAYHAGARLRARDLSHHGSLDRLFGSAKWQRLKPYLKSTDGLWGFDL